MTGQKPSVLFVCVHNAGRSQMAAGWLRELAGERVEVRSAGSMPAEQINPVAAQAMRDRVRSTLDPRWREAVVMGVALSPDNPLFSHTLFSVYVGIAVWVALWLREPKVRAVFPFVG